MGGSVCGGISPLAEAVPVAVPPALVAVMTAVVAAAVVGWPAGHRVKEGSSGLTASHIIIAETSTVTRSHWLINSHRTSSTKKAPTIFQLIKRVTRSQI